MITIFVKVT